MSSFSKQIKIYVENESQTFNYIFNQNTKFEDLLEYTSYYFPELNVCPCYNFQVQVKNQNFVITKETLIIKHIAKFNTFQLVNSYPDKQCHCKPYIKEYYKKPKIEILKFLDNYINKAFEVEKVKKTAEFFEGEKNKLQNKISSLEKEYQEKLKNLEKEKNQVIEKAKEEKEELKKKIIF